MKSVHYSVLWNSSADVLSHILEAHNLTGCLPRSPQGLPPSGSPPQIPRILRGLPTKRPIKDFSKVLAGSSAKGSVWESTMAGTTRSFLARGSSLHAHLSPPLIKPILHLGWWGKVNGQEYVAQAYSVLPYLNYWTYRVNTGFLPVDVPLAIPLVLPPERHSIDFIDNQLIPLSN